MLDIHHQIFQRKQELLVKYGRDVNINLEPERDAIVYVARKIANETKVYCNIITVFTILPLLPPPPLLLLLSLLLLLLLLSLLLLLLLLLPLPLLSSLPTYHYKVLFFDEFQVTDICDAMILMKFFNEIWNHGSILIATSNRSHNDLYKDGLNRYHHHHHWR